MAANFYKKLILMLLMSGSFLAKAQDTIQFEVYSFCIERHSGFMNGCLGIDVNNGKPIVLQRPNFGKAIDEGDTLTIIIAPMTCDARITCRLIVPIDSGRTLCSTCYQLMYPIGTDDGVIQPKPWEGIYPDRTRARRKRQEQNR